jgi:hypothetical protein
MLYRRKDRADRDNAKTLVAAALATACELGMTVLSDKLDDLNKLIDGTQQAIEDGKGSMGRQQPPDILRPEGDYWTIGFEGRICRLKDLKGLNYLAQLLGFPDREFHALELLKGLRGELDLEWSDVGLGESLVSARTRHENTSVAISGDTGEVLDSQAKVEYRLRLKELESGLAQAKRLGNVPKAMELEAEYDALTRELARAIGLGGRDRRMGSIAERARLSVTRAIRIAIEKITERDPDLGRFLSKCIRTGTFCSYNPPLNSHQSWEL